MPLIKIPYFGILDSDDLDDYYDSSMPFGKINVDIHLTFLEKTIDPKKLDIVKVFIDNIRIHDLNNKKYIDNDYNDPNGETVKAYLEHHLEELGENELSTLIDLNSNSAQHEKQLLKNLHLVEVGIFPDGGKLFAMFDYSIGKELTSYLVVITTDENGNLVQMSMDS